MEPRVTDDSACGATGTHHESQGIMGHILLELFVFFEGMIFTVIVALAVMLTLRWSQWRSSKLLMSTHTDSMSTEELRNVFSESKSRGLGLPSIFLRPDSDRASFVNDAMKSLWPHINRAATAWALEDRKLEKLLNEQTFWKPAWLAASGVILQSIFLGEEPPHVTGIKIYSPEPERPADALVADVSFDWVSKMMVQLTMKTLSEYDMSLVDRLLAIVYRGVGVKVVVRNLVAKGQLRIIAGPLVDRLPVIGSVKVSFLGAPETSYQVSSFGANPLMIPGLEAWMNSFIENTVLEPFMFPGGFLLDISDLLGMGPSDAVGSRPEGLLDVVVKSAKNLPNTDIFGLTDPYVKLFVQPKMKTRTSVKPNTLNPVWDENFEFIIHSKEHQRLSLQIYDSDVLRTDDLIGTIEVDLGELDLHPGESKELTLSVPRVGKGAKRYHNNDGSRNGNRRIQFPGSGREMKLTICTTYYPFSSQERQAAENLSTGLRSMTSLSPRIRNILRGGMLYVRVARGELQSNKALLTVKYKLKIEVGSRSGPTHYSKSWERSGLGRGLSAQHPVFDAEVDFLVRGDVAQDQDTIVRVSIYTKHPIRRPTYKGSVTVPLSRAIATGKIHDEFVVEGPKSGGTLEMGLEWLGVMESM